jgi:hypothetical protein
MKYFKIGIAVCCAALLSAGDVFAADKLTAVTTHAEFGEFMQQYYRNPQPDLVEPALKYAVAEKLWEKENSKAPLLASFSCIFARHKERNAGWNKAIAAMEEAPREFFQRAIETAPMQLLAEAEISPARNDMFWGCFFATGDERYAQEVIATMAHLEERKNMQLYLAAASAQWSLASIAKSDGKVRSVLQMAAAGKDAGIAAAAQDALTKPIKEIRDAAANVLRQQREAGAW